MDYYLDVYIGQDDFNREVLSSFIYDNRRSCSKLYVFLKLIGFLFYSTTLTSCNKSDLLIMIGVMFLSTMNNARYEYTHYQRYGTVFSSIDEFKIWKNEQWPKSRAFFSIAELAIKIVYFIKTFPPQFEFNNLCNYGESIFKIHILVLFMAYSICCIFACCMLSSFYFYDYYHRAQQAHGIPNIHRCSDSLSLIPLISINNQNEECCICLETNLIQTWSMLPCGHKFHDSCVSTWLIAHQTCPICRLDVMTVIT